MTKTTKQQINDKISEVRAALEAEFWATHQRLSREYSNRHDQVKDGQRIGKIAEASTSLTQAICHIQDVTELTPETTKR